MEALTWKQPYAQLTARGVRRFDARSWPTEFPIRLAIHASGTGETPSILFADARADRDLGDLLDYYKWRSAETLGALPRSAIVGTVELVRIIRPADLEYSPPLIGELAGEEYLWEFRDALEIAPVAGVRGKSRLWTLDDDVAKAVEEAELIARASGQPAEPAHSPASIGEHPERSWAWLNRFDKLMRTTPDELARRQREACAEEDRGAREARESELNDRYRRELVSYFARHRMRGRGAKSEVWVDNENEVMRDLFSGAEWVASVKFARAVRGALRSGGKEKALLLQALRESSVGGARVRVGSDDTLSIWAEVDAIITSASHGD